MATFPSKVNYATGDILTATNMNDVGGAINLLQSAQFAAGKNAVINGDFGIWQRGTSFAAVASGSYTSDRWQVVYDGTGVRTVSQQTFTSGTAPVSGYEGTYFYRYNQTTAGTGATYGGFQQRVEDVRLYAGQTVTLSFWAKADASRVLTYDGQQNFGSGGSATVFSVGSTTFNITTSWVRYTNTFTIPSISGKTIGTSSYFQIYFGAPVNTLQTIDIWGVQLEAASTASNFQTATGTKQGELAACQRYYAKSYNQATAPGSLVNEGYIVYSAYMNVTAVANFRQTTRFPITMRTAPSVTIYAASTTSAASGNWRNNGTAANVAAVAYYISDGGFSSYNNVTTGINQTNELSYHYEASAEL